MLTLLDTVRVGSFTVYRDVVPGAAGARRLTSRCYVQPDEPRLALAADGRPELDLLWYRAPPGAPAAGRRTGGLLTVSLDLALTPSERDAVVQGLRAALPGEDLTDLELVDVPYLDATVELTTAGGTAPVTQAPVPARLQGDARATVVVELDRDAAALVHGLLESGQPLFHARFMLGFAASLEAVRLRVWCDARRAHDLASGLETHDPAGLVRALLPEQAAGVELLEERPLSTADRERLTALGTRLVAAALGETLWDAAPGGGPTLRPYEARFETVLNHTLTASAVVRQEVVAEAVLDAGASLAELGDRVRTVDLERGFFAVLEVALVCTVDFGAGLVDRVDVEVVYDQTGADGRVLRSRTFTFGPGAGPQRFRTDLAAPDLRDISWRTSVWYHGDPVPVVLVQSPTATELVVVDLDGTGVLDVAVGLRDVADDLASGASVELEHASTGQAGRLVLDRSHPEDRWTVVTRVAPGPVRQRTTWHLVGGADVVGPWTEMTSRRLDLDLPPDLRPRTGVELVSAGDCSALAQVLVELRTGPEATPSSFAFTAPGQSARWADAGLDPADLRYEAHQVLVRSDGGRDDLGWTDRDSPVLVVGDLLRFEVVVEPRLLDLGGSLRLALLELTAPSGESRTLVLRDTLPQHWSFRMSAPGASEYQHRLTLLPVGGDRVVLSPRTARTGVLVLRPSDG